MSPLIRRPAAFWSCPLLTLGVLAAGAAAQAATPPTNRPDARVAVHTADLDLATEAGRQALDARIASAARRACAAVVSDHAIDFHLAMAECYRDAVARARGEVTAFRSIELASKR